MQSLRPSTIIAKKAGFVVPEDFLKAAITPDVTAVGFAVQEKDGDSPILFSEKMEAKPEVSDLVKMMEACKDKQAVIWLGRGEFPSEHSLQPIMFQVGDAEGKNKEDVIAIFCEGDYPKHTATDSQSSELRFVEETVFKGMFKAMKLADGDPDAFFNELRDETFSSNLLINTGHRGVIAMLPLEGDLIHIEKNDLGQEFDWGFCSQTQDLIETKEPPKQEAPAEAPAKRSFFTKTKAAVTGTMKPEETKPPAPTETPPVIVNQPKEEPPKTETSVKKGTTIPIPNNLSNKDKQRFIRKHMKGVLPKAWKHMTTVLSELPPETPAVLTKVTADNKSTVREKFVPLAEVQDAATKGTDERKIVTPTPEAAEANRMTLSAPEKQQAEEFILKYLDFNSQEAPNPLEIQKIEAKYGSFSKQVGFNPERMFLWPLDKVEEFFKRNAKFGFLAFLEMRRRAMVNEKLKLEDLAGSSKKEDAPTTTVPAETPAKKPSMFLSKRKVA